MFEATPLPDLLVVTPSRHGDARGWFTEAWSRAAWEAAGLHFDWCQDNQSFSATPGTLRGLHYQAPPMAQAKLVRCTAGRIRDVAVDVRLGSPGYGQWYGIELNAENGRQLLVPRGFLHGFVTLEPDTEVQYKVDAPYSPAHDGAVRFDDPAIAIDWSIDPAEAVLSDKDAAAPGFHDFDTPFRYKSAR